MTRPTPPSAAEYGCSVYELRQHRKAGEKHCAHCERWQPKEEYPLKGGPNSKRSTWCVTCLAERGQAACTAEERCTPEMRAAMHELLSLVTGREVA